MEYIVYILMEIEQLIKQLFIDDSSNLLQYYIHIFKYFYIDKDVIMYMNALVKDVNKYNNKIISEMLRKHIYCR